MIVEETHVTCDKCQSTVRNLHPVLYRISSGTEKFIKSLFLSGWLFKRDEKDDLVEVICPECQEGGRDEA